MQEAVKVLRQNASVSFAFGREPLESLIDLDDQVFKLRPDLELHVWSVAPNKIITENELYRLANMHHVHKIQFSGFHNSSLPNIASMVQLTSLKLGTSKQLDISFVENLTALTRISLTGSFASLASLSACTALEWAYLSTTMDSFEFLSPLSNIKTLLIDYCIASNNFSPFNKPALKNLSITSVTKLENVDALAAFENLINLRIAGAHIKTLPPLHKLSKLEKLSLSNMKVWENPEVIQTIPALQMLALEEINTKLKAEQFYFLSEMSTLKALDFRFIDVNKSRIDKLNKAFKEKGMESVLSSEICTEMQTQLMQSFVG